MKNSSFSYDSFDSKKNNVRESTFTIGNTYMGIRGIEDESLSGSHSGLFIAGLFDKSEAYASEIVNFTNLTPIYVLVDGEKVSLENTHILNYYRELDMEKGILSRKVTLKTAQGKELLIESSRFLSFYDTHCGGVTYHVTPLNFSGTLKVVTEYDSSLLSREGSYLYSEKVKHFYVEAMNDQFEENYYARLTLRDSKINVDIAGFMSCEGQPAKERRRMVTGERVEESFEVQASKGIALRITKYFVVCDSRDVNASRLKELCLSKLERMKSNGFTEELDKSVYVLKQKWEMADVQISGDEQSDLALRFNIYNLLTLGNEHSSRHSIGAKGLSTEKYGGHYFWDTEVYLMPFYLNTNTAVAKNLLKFRYNTLEKAKERAVKNGFKGCLWPWQSTAEGEEGIRNTVLENGIVERRDILDQYHIVSDIAYACFKFLAKTGDRAFFVKYLAPLVIEGMRFWVSFLFKTNDPKADSYKINNVMGPDEYHTKVNNNYYTNYLAKQVFVNFLEFYQGADDKTRFDLVKNNDLTKEELEDFSGVCEKLYIPAIKDQVIEQFEGYFSLRDMTITQYSDVGLPLYPDPKVGEGLPHNERQDALQQDATKTQLIKQADAVLAIVQNPSDFTTEVMEKTFDYYLKRSLHFSSLSPGVTAIAGAMTKRHEEAYELFKLAVNMDLLDVKEETATGLHTACHGGAYQSVVEGFAGVRGEKDFLVIDPSLPEKWKEIAFSLVYRGIKLKLKVSNDKTTVTMKTQGSLKLLFKGQPKEIVCNGEEQTYCF